jgi:hypothetical protein
MPDDPIALGNLSAAQFEIGEYTQCISTAEKVLKVLNGTNKDNSTVAAEKLKRRISRAKANCN